MFQGDSLSPVNFLTVFNPLNELSGSLTTSGFSSKINIPNSAGLPPVNSAIYEYWDGNYDEPVGWYYAVVKKQLFDGMTNIEHANNDTEIVNLEIDYFSVIVRMFNVRSVFIHFVSFRFDRSIPRLFDG